MRVHSFDDFDAFSSSVRDVDSVMMLQNATTRSWVISHVDLPRVHVQAGQLGSGNIVEGQSWPNGYLVYLPLTPACEYSANGSPIPDSGFTILEPGCEFCISTKCAHDWCSIFIPAALIDPGGDPDRLSSGREHSMCRVACPDPGITEQFRQAVNGIMRTAARCPGFESTLAASRAETELLTIGAAVVRGPQAREADLDGRPKLSRQGIIARARELLEERVDEAVAVTELAAAAGVSERTLRTAFREYFGVGPVRYLQIRLLHQVYRDLLVCDPEETTVLRVLLRHGVRNMGRFASRYRRLFGELPSQTLGGSGSGKRPRIPPIP